MLEKGDLIKLNNQKEYLVMNQINYKGNNYIYLVTKDGVSGVAICKLEEDNITPVTEEELFNELLKLFVEQMEEK